MMDAKKLLEWHQRKAKRFAKMATRVEVRAKVCEGETANDQIQGAEPLAAKAPSGMPG